MHNFDFPFKVKLGWWRWNCVILCCTYIRALEKVDMLSLFIFHVCKYISKLQLVAWIFLHVHSIFDWNTVCHKKQAASPECKNEVPFPTNLQLVSYGRVSCTTSKFTGSIFYKYLYLVQLYACTCCNGTMVIGRNMKYKVGHKQCTRGAFWSGVNIHSNVSLHRNSSVFAN